MKDDRRLIREYLSGSDQGFEDLYDRHQPALFAFAYHLLGRTQDAEDLSQTAWVQALRSLATFRGRSSFRTWLHAIALNLYRHQQRDSRLKTEPLDPRSAAVGGDPQAALAQTEEAVGLRARWPPSTRGTVRRFSCTKCRASRTARSQNSSGARWAPSSRACTMPSRRFAPHSASPLIRRCTMTCDRVQSSLKAYLDQELNLRDRAALSLHLSRCPQCRAEMEAIRIASHGFRSLTAPQSSDETRRAGARGGAHTAPLLSSHRGPSLAVVGAGLRRSRQALLTLALYLVLRPSPAQAALARVADAVRAVRTQHLVMWMRPPGGPRETHVSWYSEGRWRMERRQGGALTQLSIYDGEWLNSCDPKTNTLYLRTSDQPFGTVFEGFGVAAMLKAMKEAEVEVAQTTGSDAPSAQPLHRRAQRHRTIHHPRRRADRSAGIVRVLCGFQRPAGRRPAAPRRSSTTSPLMPPCSNSLPLRGLR